MAKVSSSKSSGGSSARRSTSSSRPASRASTRAKQPTKAAGVKPGGAAAARPAAAAEPAAAAPPKDTVRVSKEVWDKVPLPSQTVQGLENTYGKPAPPLTIRDGRTGRPWGERAPGESNLPKEWKAAAQVGEGVQKAYGKYGEVVTGAGKALSDGVKEYGVKPYIGAIQNQLDKLPEFTKPVTQPLLDIHKGAANGVAGTFEDVSQVLGKPVETVKNVVDVFKNPSKIGAAWDERVKKDGFYHAVGETFTDIAGGGKSIGKLAGKIAGVGNVAQSTGKVAREAASEVIKDGLEAGNTVSNGQPQ